jgi:hypothetical protein
MSTNSRISQESTSKKLKGQAGQKPIAAQVEGKEQLHRDVNTKECTNHRRLTSTDHTVEGRGDAFSFWLVQRGKS